MNLKVATPSPSKISHVIEHISFSKSKRLKTLKNRAGNWEARFLLSTMGEMAGSVQCFPDAEIRGM